MADITERLRLRNDPSQMLMCYPPRPAPDMLCYEAAAEIERLLLIEQGAADLCDTCGWRMKFPNQECRNCENAKLRDEIERLRDALHEWDALIRHQYSGSQEAMSDMTYAAQRTAHLLHGKEPWPEPRRTRGEER